MSEAFWGAVGAAGMTVVTALAVALKRYIEKRADVAIKRMDGLSADGKPLARRKQYEAFVRFAKFHQQLERVKGMDNVQRMLLFVGSDDGGLPDATKPYKVICRYGWAQDERLNPEESYNFNLVVDRGYCMMLAEMVKDGRTIQTTAEMQAAMLKKYYEIEGVVQSVIYLLNIDVANNEIMFASFASYVRPFTPDELNFLDVRVDRMRAILSHEGDGSELHAILP